MLQQKTVFHVSVLFLLLLVLFFFNFYFSTVDAPLKYFRHGGAHQNGNYLVITNPGFFQIKLLHKELRIEICPDDCYGNLTICYDSLDYSPSKTPKACRKTKQAGFHIQFDSENIMLKNGKLIPINSVYYCEDVLMQLDKSTLFNESIDTGRSHVLGDYIMILNVIDASPYCPLFVKNVILDDSIFPPPGPPPLTWYEEFKIFLAKPHISGLPIWFWIIVFTFSAAFVILFIALIGYVIIVTVYCSYYRICIYVKCYKKKKQLKQVKYYGTPNLSLKNRKRDEEKRDEVHETTTQAQVVESVAAEPGSTIEASSLVPSQTKPTPSIQTTKASTTNKISVTKEPGISSVQHIPPALSLPPPSPSIAATTTTTTASALSTANDGGSSSQKTSSLRTNSLPEHSTEEELLNKKVLIEPHYASLLRHKCLGENNSAKAREMRRKYPRNMGRQLEHREIKLFTLSGNEMFNEVDKMCRDAEKDLSRHGIKFDEKKGITRMTANGRSFIQSSKTPDFIAYFCFGAEYYEFVSSDISQFSMYSVPLLFTISMMPRIEEANRRKALTWIRRQIPKIRVQYPDAGEREIMAFPVNALEGAHEMFAQNGRTEKLDKLMAMSRMLMEDKTQRDTQDAAENRGAGSGGGGKSKKKQQKRKKRRALWI